MNEILLLDNNILINGHLVLRIDYNIDINYIHIDTILASLDKTMKLAATEECEKETYILLLDFKKVRKKFINMRKIKKILHHLQNGYPDKLEKCVVYNYTKLWKFLMRVILSLLDPVTKKKICFKKSLNI